MRTNLRGYQISYTDNPVFWNIASSGHWEEDVFDAIVRLLEPGTIFWDIGAWNGVHSLFAEKLGAQPYSLEPDPAAYIDLKHNFVANASIGKAFNVALGAVDGEIPLYTNGEFGNSESTILADRMHNKRSVMVNCVTLATFWNEWLKFRNVSLIKVDVEGGESVIIPAAAAWFKKYQIPMILSLHPGWFKDPEHDIANISLVLSPVYSIYNSLRPFHEIDSVEFCSMVLNTLRHTFIFLPKGYENRTHNNSV